MYDEHILIINSTLHAVAIKQHIIAICLIKNGILLNTWIPLNRSTVTNGVYKIQTSDKASKAPVPSYTPVI